MGISKPHVRTSKATRMRPDLANYFEELTARFQKEDFIETDPVMYLHRHAAQRDSELVGFISALFSYGSVVLIKRAIETILEPMGAHPHQFIIQFDASKKYWQGFSHRFHKEHHVIALMEWLQSVLREHKTLEAYFRKKFSESGSFEGMMNAVAHDFERANARRLDHGLRFLINAPEKGSTCKRMLMFLRWMVRKDEIDRGYWAWLSPSQLIIPVDTHIARISWHLRLRSGKLKRAANWKMALEITESLRNIIPDDPVKVDFALTRLGILGLEEPKR